ncbi:MAG: guanylate kinase [Candidatus Saccharibacteria bacterium]|nr:guanylate kinase [Candidatus Saccharibacteria bacterium]MDB5180586.1 guanylate kinase [Candidatus Saccharibacteria bacterium]
MNPLEEAINSYKMPETARALLLQHPSLNITGPTGAGKGTMAQHLTQTGTYVPVVSDTTRKPRVFGNGYEVNGVHYWFIDDQTALQKLGENAYMEAKLVHGDTLYGTSIASYERVINNGRTPILEIDVQGMEAFMEEAPGFECVLLLPPSFEIWEQRIDGRGDMDLQQKIRRFKTALVEYQKPIENQNFYPVINTEVIDTAKIIESGEYREESYRQKALALAVELKAATQAFLDSHQ